MSHDADLWAAAERHEHALSLLEREPCPDCGGDACTCEADLCRRCCEALCECEEDA
jgi:hypothetical protein